MTKEELRNKYKILRFEISSIEIDEISIGIANRLLNLDIWQHNYFHIFLPIIENNEPNTEFVLHLLQGKDKEIILSRSNFESLEMTHYLLTDNTKIIRNKYNIPEPIDGIVVPVEKIEVVFVPLFAYDRFGNRIGYGKGFYDRFLSKCKPEIVKIGLSFFEPEDEIIEISENDIKLNYCVTPSKIYSF